MGKGYTGVVMFNMEHAVKAGEAVLKGKAVLKVGKDSVDLITDITNFLDKMKNFKPDVKSIRINYFEKMTELKLVMHIPQGFSRAYKTIKIPAYENYSIYELYDGITFERIKVEWKLKGKYWETNSKNLSASEKYFTIMKGNISQDALDNIVKVYCPNDPKRGEDIDEYWIDSAIKDMGYLREIYSDLEVDRVNAVVDVGLERQFTSTIPPAIKQFIQAKSEHDIWFGSRDRTKEFRSTMHYRLARSALGNVSSRDIVKIGNDAQEPETFITYVKVDDPFRITSIDRLDTDKIYPERIGITVQTDLNYRRPFAEGDLTFSKGDFSDFLTKKFNSLLRKTKGESSFPPIP